MAGLISLISLVIINYALLNGYKRNVKSIYEPYGAKMCKELCRELDYSFSFSTQDLSCIRISENQTKDKTFSTPEDSTAKRGAVTKCSMSLAIITGRETGKAKAEGNMKSMEKCKSTPRIKGTVMKRNKGGNETAKYSCRKGYVKTGGSKLHSTCTDGVWTQVDIRCVNSFHCYVVVDGRGVYSGNMAKSRSGKNCQRWGSKKPQPHNRKEEHFRETSALGPETFASVVNYCRDPDGQGAPWCYTTNFLKRWERCSVPKC